MRSAISGHSSGQLVYRNVSTSARPFWALSVNGLSPASVSWKSGAGVFWRSVPWSVGAGAQAATNTKIIDHANNRFIEMLCAPRHTRAARPTYPSKQRRINDHRQEEQREVVVGVFVETARGLFV